MGLNKAVLLVDYWLFGMGNAERSLNRLFCLVLHGFQILKKLKYWAVLSKALWKGK